MKLKLAEGLSLPLDVVTQKLAWLGVTGSGKTYGASKLAELLWHVGAQFVVLDPVGVWYGLRLAKDGKKPSDVTIPIFGGLHGDVPLEPTGGALLANLVVDKTLSAIIDVSQFESDTQKARFALDFAERFFFRKKAAPSAVHVFLEECQEFVPQNPQKGDERMLHAFTRMQKLGRNFGIGSSYISQRPQEVNKKALNMAQTLFVFRTTGTHERTAIEKWIEDKSLDETIANDLPKIPTGDCHVWSPEFLKISETVHILEKATFNASATPEVGVVAKARALAPIDLDQVRTDMAATIEKAKADDPRELRKQIAELKNQLAVKVSPAPKTLTAPVGKPVLTDADRALLDKLSTSIRALDDEARRAVIDAGTNAAKLVQQAIGDYLSLTQDLALQITDAMTRKLDTKGFQKILDKLATVPHAAAQQPRLDTQPRLKPQRDWPKPDDVAPRRSFDPPSAKRRDVPAASNGAVTGAELRILNALAELEALGVREPERVQVAFFAGYTHLNSKGLVNALGALRTSGLIDYPTSGRVVMTDAGQAHAEPAAVPRTADELRQRVVQMLGGASARILEPLIQAYPNAMAREDLAAAASYGHLNSKGFVNALGRLRSLCFIDYPQQGQVAAQPVLFLE